MIEFNNFPTSVSILVWAATPNFSGVWTESAGPTNVEILAGGPCARLYENKQIKVFSSTANSFSAFLTQGLSKATGQVCSVLLPGYMLVAENMPAVLQEFVDNSKLAVVSGAAEFSPATSKNPILNSYGLGPLVCPSGMLGTDVISACLNPPCNRLGALPAVFFRTQAGQAATFDDALGSQAIIDFLFQLLKQGHYKFVNERLAKCNTEQLPPDTANDAASLILECLRLIEKYQQYLPAESSPSWLVHLIAHQASKQSPATFENLVKFNSEEEALRLLLTAALQTVANAPFSIRDTFERHCDNVALNKQKIELHNAHLEAQAKLHAEIQELSAQLQSLKNSSSWKMTAPIRMLRSATSKKKLT